MTLKELKMGDIFRFPHIYRLNQAKYFIKGAVYLDGMSIPSFTSLKGFTHIIYPKEDLIPENDFLQYNCGITENTVVERIDPLDRKKFFPYSQFNIRKEDFTEPSSPKIIGTDRLEMNIVPLPKWQIEN